MGTGKDSSLQGVDSRQGEPPTTPAKSSPGTTRPADVELELERLRAERDAMAAELQIERAERLHVEERLRLLEREKLEQMRQGAASREKLASELEESRLRAMRAEGRHAALEADTRLAEIELRRRGSRAGDAELGPLANEIAEPPADEPAPADEAEDEPESVEPAPQRPGSSLHRTSTTRQQRKTTSSAERRPPAPEPDLLPTSRLRGPQTAPRTPDERGPGARMPPPKKGSPGAGSARGGGSTAGDTTTKGGAAAGRPSIDRARLEASLTGGATIKTTDRFKQFQPVAQSHIKVCDWLLKAKTLAELEELAAGQIPTADILNVLVLFFERSFLELDR